MPLSDTHKTPKQNAMAKAVEISKQGKAAWLCQYEFSLGYFAMPESEWKAFDRCAYRVIRRYPAA